MKLIWRKKEFQEFIGFRSWAFMRRRVDEMPVYVYPIGFGFSIVKSIRQGYWIDEETGTAYVGFLKSGSNFHYFPARGSKMRSEANWPKPPLKPISFEEGYYLHREQEAAYYGHTYNAHISGTLLGYITRETQ